MQQQNNYTDLPTSKDLLSFVVFAILLIIVLVLPVLFFNKTEQRNLETYLSEEYSYPSDQTDKVSVYLTEGNSSDPNILAVDVNLITSGDPFQGAVFMLNFDAQQLEFIQSGEFAPHNNLSGGIFMAQPFGSNADIIQLMWGQVGDQTYSYPYGQSVIASTLYFTKLVDNINSPITIDVNESSVANNYGNNDMLDQSLLGGEVYDLVFTSIPPSPPMPPISSNTTTLTLPQQTIPLNDHEQLIPILLSTNHQFSGVDLNLVYDRSKLEVLGYSSDMSDINFSSIIFNNNQLSLISDEGFNYENSFQNYNLGNIRVRPLVLGQINLDLSFQPNNTSDTNVVDANGVDVLTDVVTHPLLVVCADDNLLVCSNSCINPQTDSNNCGACGNVCTGSSICSSGMCRPSCQVSETLCSDTCVDIQTDPNNCGACGQVCLANQSCTAGSCVATGNNGVMLSIMSNFWGRMDSFRHPNNQEHILAKVRIHDDSANVDLGTVDVDLIYNEDSESNDNTFGGSSINLDDYNILMNYDTNYSFYLEPASAPWVNYSLETKDPISLTRQLSDNGYINLDYLSENMTMCIGDINGNNNSGDGIVNTIDYSVLINNFGNKNTDLGLTKEQYFRKGDFDKDGRITTIDWAIQQKCFK